MAEKQKENRIVLGVKITGDKRWRMSIFRPATPIRPYRRSLRAPHLPSV